jgi:hypothetical protein
VDVTQAVSWAKSAAQQAFGAGDRRIDEMIARQA